MRYALYRITAPILERIPDISHQPKGRQMSIGLVASLLFHLLLLLLALLAGVILPERSLLHLEKAKPKLEEIELTIVPPEPQEVRLVPMEEIEHPKPFIDSRGLAASEQAPDKPLFDSDANMKAASELPALGDAPLPSQDGRVEPEFPAFASQQMALGKTATPFSSNVAVPMPPVEPTPPAPPPAPEPTVAEQKTPPPPMKEVVKPGENEIAVAAKAAPATPAPAVPKLQMRATIPVAMLATPVPQPRKKTGYQPQLQKTRIEGNISNRGRNAVDAAGTPLGRYKKAVYDAVGSRWYHFTAQKTSIIAPGSVRVSFSIDDKGRPIGVKSEGNTSNGSFADMCEQAVREAEIAPPPGDLMEPLLDGKLDFTITFSFHTF